MDFSKINLKNPNGPASSKPAESQAPVIKEVPEASTSKPAAGINFKNLNITRPGNPNSDEASGRKAPANDSSTRVDPAENKDSKPAEAARPPIKLNFPAHTRPEPVAKEVSSPIANPVNNKVAPIANPVVRPIANQALGNVANVDSVPKVSPMPNSVVRGDDSQSSPIANSSLFGGEDLSTIEDRLDDSVENPFLDDDEEYVLNVDEIAQKESKGTSYDPDAADAEPFFGFPESSPASRSVASSNSDDDFDGSDGFDDLLDDLLEEESYESFSKPEVGVRVSSPIANSVPARVVNPVEDEVSPIANPVVKPVVGGKAGSVAPMSDEVRVALDNVKNTSRREIELDPVLEADRLRRREEKQAVKDERDASRKPGKKKEAKRVRLESEFVKQPPVEVLVDADGRPLSKLSNAGKSTSAHAKDGSEKSRYRYLRNDGKINSAELDFFKNALTNKSRALAEPNEMTRLRGPVDRNESEAERQDRQKQITRAAAGRKGLQRGSRPRFGQKEREVLEFLAMFRYATDRQLSRMFSESQGTTYNRLKRLRQQGLVIDKKIYGNRPIWFLTEAGLVISGYDLPRVTESKLTFSMFPHQFTVNNTAANLWGANVNVLHQPDFPAKYRVNSKGENTFGENLVSELEIQSSFGKVKGFDKSDVYRPQLLKNIEREFRDWERAGGVEFGPSPEMIYGNEYMWSLMPPYNVHLAYHVPDLVIKRPRNADGTPNSIAVEIEISNKPSDSYEKTLYAYRSDNTLYKKVIWICKSAGPARKLETIAKEIGLWQAGKIDIVPVITEDGVFKERDLWTI